MNPNLKPRFTEFRGIIVTDMNRGNCHAKILMTAIENVVSSLDDPEILASYMLEIGKRHARLDLKPSKSHVRIDPLHDAVTWYGINYAGTQVTQWDFQNKGTPTSPARLPFVLKFPLCNLRPSIINSVPCDRIVQRAQ